MSEFFKKDDFIKNAYFFSLLLVCISLPFSNNWNSYFIVAFSFFSFFYIIKSKSYLSFNKNLLLPPVILYISHYFGFLNSENFQPVFFDIKQKLSLLIFPFAIGLAPKLSPQRVRIIFLFFIGTTFLVSVLTFRNGFYTAWQNFGLYDNLILHRPYLGMYCVISTFFLIEFLLTESSLFSKIIISIVILFFFVFLVFIIAKMAIITQLVLLYLFFVFDFYQRRSMKFLYASILLPFVIILIIIFTNNVISDYVFNIIHLNDFSFKNYDSRIVNSFNIRFGLWKCSFESLAENYNWIAGVGTGDSMQVINKCINNTMGGFFTGYDPHNQYLSYLINLGIIGLTLFLVTIIYPLLNSIKKKRRLQFIFIFAIAVFCLTEGIFNLQVGIVFFSLFYSLLVIKDYKDQSIIS